MNIDINTVLPIFLGVFSALIARDVLYSVLRTFFSSGIVSASSRSEAISFAPAIRHPGTTDKA